MMFRVALFKHPVTLIQYLDWVPVIPVCVCRVVAVHTTMYYSEMHSADNFKAAVYNVHNSPKIVPILSQFNSVHALPSYSFKIRFHIILKSTPVSSGIFLEVSPACIKRCHLLACLERCFDHADMQW